MLCPSGNKSYKTVLNKRKSIQMTSTSTIILVMFNESQTIIDGNKHRKLNVNNTDPQTDVNTCASCG